MSNLTKQEKLLNKWFKKYRASSILKKLDADIFMNDNNEIRFSIHDEDGNWHAGGTIKTEKQFYCVLKTLTLIDGVGGLDE